MFSFFFSLKSIGYEKIHDYVFPTQYTHTFTLGDKDALSYSSVDCYWKYHINSGAEYLEYHIHTLGVGG